MSEPCLFCSTTMIDGKEMCRDKYYYDKTDENRYWVCTREKGHKGPHVGCSSSDHPCKDGIWANEETV